MFTTTHIITNNILMIKLTLFLLLVTTIHSLPQSQNSGRNNNNNLRGREGRQNNNRNPVTTNGGQRKLEGGFVPSNFGNEIRNVRFPDNVARPVGRRQPGRSPFRNSDLNTEDPVQNGRRPNVGANAQNGRRPNPTRRPRPPQREPRVLLPAIPISSKYTGPRFDVLGNPLAFKAVIPEERDLLPDFRDPTGARNRGQNRKTTKPPGFRRPKTTNLGPDLRPKLPIFGQPELILKATEELRNSDVNQNAIIPLGAVNAGVLPLATESEEDQKLGFFPPFNVRKIQPK